MSDKKIIELDVKTNAEQVGNQFGKLADNAEKVNKAEQKVNKTNKDLHSSFEDVYGEIKPLTAQMGEMEDKLYQMALAGEQNTEQFKELLTEVGKYKQTQQLTDLTVDAAAMTMDQKLGGALQGAASGFAVVQGAMGLFGTESEELEKTLLKVNSAMALAQGITGLREGAKSFRLLGASAVKALKGIKVGFAATGIGLFLVALGTVAAYWDDISKAVGFAGDEQEGYNQILKATTSDMESLFKELIEVETAFELAKDGTISKKKALEKYNETLGDVIGEADNLEMAEKLYLARTDAYVKATMLRSQANAFMDKAAQERVKALEKQQDMEITAMDEMLMVAKSTATAILGVTGLVKSSGNVAEDVIENVKDRTGLTNQEIAEDFEKESGKLLKQAKELEKEFNINSKSGRKDRHRSRAQSNKDRVKQFENVEERILQLQNEFNNKRLHNIFKSAKHQYEKERIDILNNENIKQEDKEKLILALDNNWKQRYAKILEDDRRREFDFEHQTQIMLLDLKEKTRESEIALLEKQREKEKEVMQRQFDDGEMTLKEFSDRSVAMGEVSRQKIADVNAKYDQIDFDKQDEQFKLLSELRETEEEQEITKLIESYEAKFELAKGNAILEAELQKSLNAEILKLNQKTAEEQKEIDRNLMASKLEIAHAGLGAIGSLVNALAGENEKAQKRAFNINKAVGIAQATISTGQGIMKAMAETTDITPTQSLRFANAAIVGIAGVAQIANIAKQQFKGSGSGGGDIPTPSNGGGSGTAPQPSFNVVGDSGINQLAQLQMQPTQAFVVSGDITTAQSLDRNKIENATL